MATSFSAAESFLSDLELRLRFEQILVQLSRSGPLILQLLEDVGGTLLGTLFQQRPQVVVVRLGLLDFHAVLIDLCVEAVGRLLPDSRGVGELLLQILELLGPGIQLIRRLLDLCQ